MFNEEKSNGNESRMMILRDRLNSQYDAFVKKYGHLNSQTNRSLMREDPEHSLLESPETARKHGGTARPASAKKAAIFRQRVLKPAQAAETAENARDALLIALRENGRVDFSRMAQLLHRPAEIFRRNCGNRGRSS